jgi:cytolysin-activating lysine-acyltransferase
MVNAARNPAFVASKTDSSRDDRVLFEGMKFSSAFGDVVGLLMRSPQLKRCPIEELEWLLLPAIQTLNYSIAKARTPERVLPMPVGAVVWAAVCDTVDARMTENFKVLKDLSPQDWKGGNNIWLILAEGHPSVIQSMLANLARNRFKGHKIKTNNPIISSIIRKI